MWKNRITVPAVIISYCSCQVTENSYILRSYIIAIIHRLICLEEKTVSRSKEKPVTTDSSQIFQQISTDVLWRPAKYLFGLFSPSFIVTLEINLLVKCISSMRSDTAGNVTRPHLSGENILIIKPLKAVRRCVARFNHVSLSLAVLWRRSAVWLECPTGLSWVIRWGPLAKDRKLGSRQEREW